MSHISTDIAAAAQALTDGQLVGMPTETVYGLAADARNAQAIEAVFRAKGRPADHPVILHIHQLDELNQWAKDIPDSAYQLAEAFWPGPMTLILPKTDDVLDLVTGGQDSIGIRMPAHPMAQALLQQFGHGVIAPSANQFGHLSPTCAQDVIEELGEHVNLVLDGGDCPVGIESTIVDVRNNTIAIARQGMISAHQIQTVTNNPISLPTQELRVSGNMAAHYAPRTPVVLVPSDELSHTLGKHQQSGERVSVLALERYDHPQATWFCMPREPIAYAQQLYRQLRAADHLNADVIIVERPPAETAWVAILDRLMRAAAHLH